MRKGFWKQLSYEDKFDRKYKRSNRRTARRKLKKMEE